MILDAQTSVQLPITLLRVERRAVPMSELRSSLFLFLVVVALAISAVLPVANSQTLASTASFSGSVSDPSGARVASANVTLSSPEKGITRTFKTDALGNFSFPLLPASTYTLAVEASGFKTFKQQGIMLEVGQSVSQNISLTVGSSCRVFHANRGDGSRSSPADRQCQP